MFGHGNFLCFFLNSFALSISQIDLIDFVKSTIGDATFVLPIKITYVDFINFAKKN